MKILTLFVGAAVTYLLVWLVAAFSMRFSGVPKGFPPFTALPLLSGVVGGFSGAAVIYAIFRRLLAQPDRTFIIFALVTLALSLSLPIRLSFTKSQRFSGVTPAAQITLALLHPIVAAGAVSALTRTGKLS